MHCSARFQERMFEICDEAFGKDILYLPDDVDDVEMKFLPSPEELKGKIIFKGKGAKAKGDSDDSDDDAPAPSAGGGAGADQEGKKGKKGKKKKGGKHKKDKPDQQRKKSKEELALLAESKTKPDGGKHQHKGSERWSSLIYLCAKKFEGFDRPGRPFEMASYSEGKAKKLCGPQRARFIEYNKRQLARIYPWGGRFDSSNLDPSPSWAAGCQLVALNFQTGDQPMWLNRGRFAENGGLGYVLKPPHMRGTGPPLPPARLAVTVLSCQRLPNNNASYDIADVYVSAAVHAVDAREQRTQTVGNNGLNPAYGSDGAGERLEFGVAEPEVAVLRLVAWDDDFGKDEVLGQFCLPVACVRTGVRHVPLYDAHNTRFQFASLLCRFELGDY